MAEQQDNAQRTEEPTPKRLAEARKKGDAPKSQEVIAAAILAAGALAIWLLADPAMRGFAEIGVSFLDRPHDFVVDGPALQHLFAEVALALAAAGGGLLLLFLIAALAGNIGQALPVWTTERMKPSLQKLSPIAGAKRIFGPSGMFNFAKGVGKLIIVGAILAFALWPDRDLLVTALFSDSAGLLELARLLVIKLIGLTLIAMLVIAALDYGFQRNSWKKRLRMTKEEIRRELKETEGDPQIKGRLRQQREQRARQRNITAVKNAAVLIMNPTHYAVALDYEMGAAEPPRCVAKGVDNVALKMRDVAREHNIPIVENPPLARALHASIDIDDEIPFEHYEAVAQVIGFVMNNARKAAPTPMQ
ncbi:MAG: flagellar biosynthesis protein FlhB [Marinicaulis sp.]|nr:flagellar biosynthesis protein FlhB [Marinicaulis sp.]